MYTHSEIWNCNWLQMVENSMDAVHVSFVHQKERGGNFGEAVAQAIPELHYVETEAGIRQTADRGVGNVRISNWTFPNNNHINLPGLQADHAWIDVGHWNTPIDDEHTMRVNIWSTPSQGADIDRVIMDYFEPAAEYQAADHHDELMNGVYPDDPLFSLATAQDYVTQVGQGVIVDREREVLGRSDAGISLLRRMLFREIEAIRTGREPKAWRRLAQSAKLPIQRASIGG